MEAMSASVSEASLHDTRSQLTVINERTNGDTPLPRKKLSDETLTDLMEAKLKLESDVRNGNLNKKRKSEDEAVEGPSTDTSNRDRYPVESKPIYLQLKNLVKKKVTMAASIKTLETNMGWRDTWNQTNIEKLKHPLILELNTCLPEKEGSPICPTQPQEETTGRE